MALCVVIGMANMNSQSSEIPSVASTPNIRGKSDPVWGHFSETRGPNIKTTYTCM